MSTISAYLTFNGNCREAMHFYQRCLGGELSIQTVGEPTEHEFPHEMEQLVLQATLSGTGFRLYATDLTHDQPRKNGNAISLFLDLDNEQQFASIFDMLSQNGTPIQLPEENAWGDLTGEVKDQFGHQWLLHYSKH